MLTIYKYKIPLGDSFAIEMPQGARALSIQIQRGVPQLWALVDNTAPKVMEQFELRGTGHDCAGLEKAQHVGSFQLDDGALVFHVFHKKGI